MKNRFIILPAAVLLAFSFGLVVRGWMGGAKPGNQTTELSDAASVRFYTCSMHPQIRQPNPGKCPVCGMDLIPVSDTGPGVDRGGDLVMSEKARKLAEVQTVAVERKYVTAEIRMVGKVEYDETKVSYITAWVPGRIDRLYVDYTGVPVKEGDHMVKIYSPELLQAQEELISAQAASAQLMESKNNYLKARAVETIESAREKLRLWGVNDDQIREIESRGIPSNHITINSPISGIVVQKNILEGMYVQTGTRIYTIADLSRVWVKLDAYESDIAWLHYGQEVEFRTEAYPGEVFEGQIAFIDPILNPQTRTVKIRVNLPNPQGKLKPDMFARAVVKSRIAGGGRVLSPSLVGKWISPMHPEIVKDQPGHCDICGMDLVRSESLGFVSAEHEEPPLVIPASAPLITGKRAVVYVDQGDGAYEGREIEIGPKAGDYYLVVSGLREGERVVTKGNFKIDSAVQILAKPSMMNPDGGGSKHGQTHDVARRESHAGTVHGDPEFLAVPESFQQECRAFLDAYLEVQSRLSRDLFSPEDEPVRELGGKLKGISAEGLSQEARSRWEDLMPGIREGVNRISDADGIEDARTGFKLLSEALIHALKRFGINGPDPMLVFHCPMAFKGEGGDWIQDREGIQNPFYGSKMLECGDLKEKIPSAPPIVEIHDHE